MNLFKKIFPIPKLASIKVLLHKHIAKNHSDSSLARPSRVSASRGIFSKNKLVLVLFVMLILLAVGGAGAGFYFYNQYQKTQVLLKNPEEASKRDVKEMLLKIGKLVELPGGEEPNVATVVDKEKLAGQPFFERAENGDKVIIYTQAKRAMLYRPKTNKIVDITTLSIGSVAGIASQTRVAIYNGTTVNNLAQTARKRLEEKFGKGIEVVLTSRSKKTSYKKSQVIALSDQYKNDAQDIAKFIGGEIGNISQDELKPDADVLVILGEDFNINK